MKTTILEMDHVSFQYSRQKGAAFALHDVSASFFPGGIHAVVGKSGSGKSTMLALLAGIVLADSGDVRFCDKSLAQIDRSAYRRSEVSVIYQEYNLLPLFSVEENVMYPLELSGISSTSARLHAREHLTALGLHENLWKKSPKNLSGGEQQRVAIARALACGCKIILADEPTGNLDSENTHILMDRFTSLAHGENQYCIVIATHDREITKTSDFTFTLSDGQITG